MLFFPFIPSYLHVHRAFHLHLLFAGGGLVFLIVFVFVLVLLVLFCYGWFVWLVLAAD